MPSGFDFVDRLNRQPLVTLPSLEQDMIVRKLKCVMEKLGQRLGVACGGVVMGMGGSAFVGQLAGGGQPHDEITACAHGRTLTKTTA